MAKSNGWLTARLPEPYYLPTPSFGINRALGGRGLASGRIHVYWGVKASGKTTVAFQQIAQAQKEGKVCAFIDAERAISPEWAEKNGVDLDALLYMRENSAEKILTTLLPDLEAGKIDIVVVDSLSSINFDSFFDENDPGKNAMGSYARSAKMFTHKVLSHLQYEQHVILISHAAMDLSGQRPALRAAVGNAIDHWCSTMIKVSKSMAKDRQEEDGSFPVDWRIDKSKQSVYPVSGTYYFSPHTTKIDYYKEIFTYGVEEGLVERSGAWYSYGPMEKKVQGEGGFIRHMKENPDLFDALVAELSSVKVEAEDDEDA